MGNKLINKVTCQNNVSINNEQHTQYLPHKVMPPDVTAVLVCKSKFCNIHTKWIPDPFLRM